MSSRRAALLGLTVLSVMVLNQPSAMAIFNGEPDGNGHPNVGVLFFQRFYAPGVLGPHAACTGVLISVKPPILLTNAHCTEIFKDPAVAAAGVHFEPSYDPFNPPRLIPAVSWASHPDYAANNPAVGMRDLGVVILKKAPNVTPARLPSAGLLDAMKASGTIDDQPYIGVGYGCTPTLTGQPDCPYDGVRRVGSFPFRSLTNDWLEASNRSDSGACSGDSGSPKFIGTSDTVAALTSWGDTQCRATDFNIRLDTSSARGFLDDFVSLPA